MTTARGFLKHSCYFELCFRFWQGVYIWSPHLPTPRTRGPLPFCLLRLFKKSAKAPIAPKETEPADTHPSGQITTRLLFTFFPLSPLRQFLFFLLFAQYPERHIYTAWEGSWCFYYWVVCTSTLFPSLCFWWRLAPRTGLNWLLTSLIISSHLLRTNNMAQRQNSNRDPSIELFIKVCPLFSFLNLFSFPLIEIDGLFNSAHQSFKSEMNE